MKDLPFSMPIEQAREFYLNGGEVLEVISPEAADVWPRLPNKETLIHDKNQRILYSVSTISVFAGPGRDDWKPVITHVYDRDKKLVYSTDVGPYLDASADAYNHYKKGAAKEENN